jgi:hypothetical protein
MEAVEAGEGLQGFAEAHFVGEDAAEAGAVEVEKPGDADLLVDPEGVFELGSEGRGGEFGEVAERAAAGGPGFGRAEGGLREARASSAATSSAGRTRWRVWGVAEASPPRVRRVAASLSRSGLGRR